MVRRWLDELSIQICNLGYMSHVFRSHSNQVQVAFSIKVISTHQRGAGKETIIMLRRTRMNSNMQSEVKPTQPNHPNPIQKGFWKNYICTHVHEDLYKQTGIARFVLGDSGLSGATVARQCTPVIHVTIPIKWSCSPRAMKTFDL